MPNTRKDAWKLPSNDDTLLWYARGVAALQTRAVTDPTSWLYLAAMHGFDESLWRNFGYLPAGVTVPPALPKGPNWEQCQHHTWYFLSWHRGYLGAFEAIVRAAVVAAGGPATWALPYWNYNDAQPGATTLPPLFTQPRLPDGTPNALYVEQRVNNVDLPADYIDLTQALTDDEFNGPGGGGSPGFGGAETVFAHNGSRQAEGYLEQVPHDAVHGAVGGDSGLMADPDTAALDPIFWLHHANIDRLWEVWRTRVPGRTNPTDPAWLNGPLVGRAFQMPAPDGTFAKFTASDMLDTKAPRLNYVYEDTSDPLAGATRAASRLAALNVPARAAVAQTGGGPMPRKPVVELLGANDSSVKLDSGPVETQVRLDRQVLTKVTTSLASRMVAAAAPSEPDRVFLNLENIRGTNDSAVFRVYVNLPAGADPAAHPEHRVGVVSLFGMKAASNTEKGHDGNGLSKVLEITSLVDRLHLSGTQLDQLSVRLVPASGVRAANDVTVGRVSVYRQGQ